MGARCKRHNPLIRKTSRKLRKAFQSLRAEKYPQIPSALRRSNTIFVHVPKAAGSTINLSLFGYRIGHRSIESFWQADPIFTEQAFKFTFVRHPYFRFVSAYRYLLAGGMSSRDADYQRRFPDAFRSLRAFAEASEDPAFRNAIIHLRQQCEYLSIPSTAHYKVFMDYVGKTEFLNEHIELLQTLMPDDLSRRLQLAKEVRMNSMKSQDSEIDPDVFQSVRKTYQNDFELFGYDEWGTTEKAKNIKL
jgi:hypothetical protein